MPRTRILQRDNPDGRAKRSAAVRKLPLTDMARHKMELPIDRGSRDPRPRSGWVLPRFDGGGIKIPLERLRDVVVG